MSFGQEEEEDGGEQHHNLGVTPDVTQQAITAKVEEPLHSRRMKNRSRLSIVARMLELSEKGALKTHLMYNANLRFSMLKSYLDYLVVNGLLSPSSLSKGGKVYVTSEKGLRFLVAYRGLV